MLTDKPAISEWMNLHCGFFLRNLLLLPSTNNDSEGSCISYDQFQLNHICITNVTIDSFTSCIVDKLITELFHGMW